jgi:putative endonuclease
MAEERAPSAKRTAAEKRGRAGEIDLIAEKSGIVVFVEVKARRQANAAVSAVTLHVWNRIARAANHWMAKHPRYSEHGWRCDITAIAPSRLPVHLRDAWRP